MRSRISESNVWMNAWIWLPEQHTVSTFPVIMDSLLQWFSAASHFLSQTVEAEETGCGAIHKLHINCFLVGGKGLATFFAQVVYRSHRLHQFCPYNDAVTGWYRSGKSFFINSQFFVLMAIIEGESSAGGIRNAHIPELDGKLAAAVTKIK